MNDEIKKQHTATLVKWGVIGVTAAVIAPLAWMAVTGIAGLMIAGGLVIVGTNAAPWLALKAANMRYRALGAERVEHIEKVSNAAAVNPIETLIIQSQEKRNASDIFRTAITVFRTEIKNFTDQTNLFKKEYPEDVARFENQLDAMNKLLTFRESRYKQLQIELDNFDSAIKRAQAMWKMSQAAQKMNKMAGMELGDPFEKIKADSAINSVMSSMNKAFAEMETALMDNKEVQQATLMVENDPQPTLTVGTVVQQKVGV
jgi:hypothetical protein